MKTLTLKLPDPLMAEIEAEAHKRRISKSEVVRERLRERKSPKRRASHLDAIADLIGSVDDDLPADLSARVDHYLGKTGFGRNSAR